MNTAALVAVDQYGRRTEPQRSSAARVVTWVVCPHCNGANKTSRGWKKGYARRCAGCGRRVARPSHDRDV